ncbi:MAG: hypothetical protein FJ304_25920 [Planctomycetes bacterium]|nr:hypothetical protein [Planctomycetota bacterium]
MQVTCIKCWDADALVKLHLDGSQVFECEGCDEKFECADVRGMIEVAKKWAAVLKWVEAAPVEEEAALS